MRITASLYFEKVHVKGLENIPKDDPVILACNHPNSFLDALILTYYYRRPIFYIARGDAFKKPTGAKMLRFLNNVPIFRKEEGVNNMATRNEETFSYCLEVLDEGDTVLLFSEGLCENEWFLRPLRKGTARLVYDAWNDPAIGDRLKVIPVAYNYSNWHGAGNIMNIELMKPIEKNSIPDSGEQGLFLRKFNTVLATCLGERVVSIDKTKDIEAQNTVTGFLLKNFADGVDMAKIALREYSNPEAKDFQKKFTELANYIKHGKLKYYDPQVNIVGFLASAFIITFSFILNIIPYSVCKYIAEKTTRRNVFYDSVFFGSALILGPLYILIIWLLILHFTHSWYSILLPIITMLSAWSYEASKRNIYCFLNKKKLAKVTPMLIALFGKGNG